MRRFLLIALLCLLASGVVLAQDGTPSLIAVFNGQVYRMEGDTLVAYDACTPDEQMTPQFFASPDGTQFLMGTMPRIISEAMVELGGLGDAPVAFNFWVCDTTTDTLNRITTLPGGDEPFSGELPPIPAMQGRPVWSPDGGQVAWATVTVLGDSYGLIIYDLATGEMTEAPLNLPPPFMFPTPPELFWGETGIYMTLFSFNEESFLGEDTLYTFDLATGTFSSTAILLTEGESSDFITDRLLVTTDGTEQFLIHLFEAGWVLVNPATGEEAPVDGVPSAYADGARDGVNLLMDVDDNFMYGVATCRQ